MIKKIVVTIDGPAASGKGTLARALGRIFDLRVLDTGLLYRLVGLAAHRALIDPHDHDRATDLATSLAAGLTLDQLKHPDLRGALAGRYASVYSALPGVRRALIDFQREFADAPPMWEDGHHAVGAILDGRDCGTEICPLAPLKFYVIADVSVRARRRTGELIAYGEPAVYEDILKDLMVRDHRDMTRAVAPTKPADDAVILDTTYATPAQVVENAAVMVEDRLGLARDVLLENITRHPEERA